MDIINKEKILEHAKKLVGEGKLERAIAEYQRILSLDPDDLRVKVRIAELFIKRKQIQEAIKIYQEVAQKYADDGFYLKAVTVYKNILRLNPSLMDVNKSLAELYEKMGLIQDALYQYQIISTAMERKNDVAGQTQVREKMIELDPRDASLRVRLAESLQLSGEVDKAIDIYESLAQQKKDAGDSDDFIELYSKILAHRPEKHEYLRFMCRIYYKRGEWKEILKRMEAAKEFIANDTELLQMQADVFARLNQLESAKQKFGDLANLLLEAKDLDGALSVYESILFWVPDEEANVLKSVEEIKEGAFKKIKTRVDERRNKLAEEESKKAEEPTVDIVVRTSDATAGKSVEANKLIRDARTAYDLGIAYKKVGLAEESDKEFSKAAMFYRQILSAGPNLEAQQRLDELKGEPAKPTEQAKPAELVKPIKPVKPKKISFV